MSWIKTIAYRNASSTLKKLYDRVKGPNDEIDNVLSIHSLRPHTLKGHMGLYKSVLHNSENSLPKWYLELLGVYVSYLNKCEYCIAHHSEGLKKLVQDETTHRTLMEGVKNDILKDSLNSKHFAGIRYAKILTLESDLVTKTDVEHLRKLDFDDGEILELNQVISYFNYVNRTVLGLGVNLQGDILGLSPNDELDSTNWNHS